MFSKCGTSGLLQYKIVTQEMWTFHIKMEHYLCLILSTLQSYSYSAIPWYLKSKLNVTEINPMTYGRASDINGVLHSVPTTFPFSEFRFHQNDRFLSETPSYANMVWYCLIPLNVKHENVKVNSTYLDMNHCKIISFFWAEWIGAEDKKNVNVFCHFLSDK